MTAIITSHFENSQNVSFSIMNVMSSLALTKSEDLSI